MSSIVKKSSHFAPKVKKRAVRREATATPPASQLAEDPAGSRDKETGENAPVVPAQALSPPATQTAVLPKAAPAKTAGIPTDADGTTASTLLNYSISTQQAAQPLAKGAAEPVVDPMQKVPAPAAADGQTREEASDNDDDYGDNDIFKQPAMLREQMRRKLSVAAGGIAHLRLVGLGSRRNSAYSGAGLPTVGAPEEQLQAHAQPVPIGVPQGKPSRKRPLASGPRGGPGRKAQRASVVAIGPVTDTLREEAGEAREHGGSAASAASVAGAAVPASPSRGAPEQEFVVALCEKTNKLRKFRTSANVQSDLPIAPAKPVTTILSVQQLPRRVRQEDEALYAQISVQAEHMSMADLCKPMLQIGQKCETFSLAEAARARILTKKNERREARAMARRYRISYQQALRELQRDHVDPEQADTGAPKGFDFERAARDDELAQAATTNLKIAVVDGQFQVDQESVVRGREFAPNSDNRTVELENPFENPITSNTYSGKAHTDPWTKEELVQLYTALSTWGTDFTFIAQLFPYRTRRQVKNKFTLEEKHNPQLVELALRRKLPPDFEDFCAKASGVKVPKTVEEFNRELAELKRDHDAHIRDINSERERAIKEDLEANRKREIEIRTGSKPMTKAERSRMIRQNEVVVGEIEDVKRTRELLDAGAH